MKSTPNKGYPTAVWITTIILGAIFLLFLSFFLYPTGDPGKEIPERVIALLVMGTFFSSFLFVVLYLVYQRMIRSESIDYKKLRIILCLLTVGCILLYSAFLGIDVSFGGEEMVIPLCYSLAAIIAVYYNKAENKEDNLE